MNSTKQKAILFLAVCLFFNANLFAEWSIGTQNYEYDEATGTVINHVEERKEKIEEYKTTEAIGFKRNLADYAEAFFFNAFDNNSNPAFVYSSDYTDSPVFKTIAQILFKADFGDLPEYILVLPEAMEPKYDFYSDTTVTKVNEWIAYHPEDYKKLKKCLTESIQKKAEDAYKTAEFTEKELHYSLNTLEILSGDIQTNFTSQIEQFKTEISRKNNTNRLLIIFLTLSLFANICLLIVYFTKKTNHKNQKN